VMMRMQARCSAAKVGPCSGCTSARAITLVDAAMAAQRTTPAAAATAKTPAGRSSAVTFLQSTLTATRENWTLLQSRQRTAARYGWHLRCGPDGVSSKEAIMTWRALVAFALLGTVASPASAVALPGMRWMGTHG